MEVLSKAEARQASNDIMEALGGKESEGTDNANPSWELLPGMEYIFLGCKTQKLYINDELQKRTDGTPITYNCFSFLAMPGMEIQRLSYKPHKGKGWEAVPTFAVINDKHWEKGEVVKYKTGTPENRQEKEIQPCVFDFKVEKLEVKTSDEVEKLVKAATLKRAKARAEEGEAVEA